MVRAVISRAGAAQALISRTLIAVVASASLAIAAAGCGSYVPPTVPSTVAVAPTSASPQAAVWASNELGMRLLAHVDRDHNAVISPYSVQTALAMLMQGARGKTLTQMESTLNGSSAATLASANRALAGHVALASSGFPQASHPTLQSAASLWIRSGLELKHDFSSVLSRDFGAVPDEIDFNDASQSIQQINTWASAKTDGLIPNLMSEGSVTSDTRLVLATAIYLKAQWSHPFKSSLTTNRPFELSSGSSTSVAMMQMQSAVKLPYGDFDDYQAVELPYRSSNLAMLAVMPSVGHMNSLLSNLNAASFQYIENTLHETRELVAMPKVSLSLSSDIAPQLAQVGMPDAFSTKADLTGITDTPVHVKAVEHAAVMRVYPSGTTAAAATGVSVGPTAVLRPARPTLTFNHPYYLFLIDRSTGVALFAARVTDPSQG